MSTLADVEAIHDQEVIDIHLEWTLQERGFLLDTPDGCLVIDTTDMPSIHGGLSQFNTMRVPVHLHSHHTYRFMGFTAAVAHRLHVEYHMGLRLARTPEHDPDTPVMRFQDLAILHIRRVRPPKRNNDAEWTRFMREAGYTHRFAQRILQSRRQGLLQHMPLLRICEDLLQNDYRLLRDLNVHLRYALRGPERVMQDIERERRRQEYERRERAHREWLEAYLARRREEELISEELAEQLRRL